MKLYHGTNVKFDKIDLMKSKPNKDFGRGFYLSDNYEQAMEMAKTKVVRNLHYMKGITIQYFFGTERALQQLKRL